MPNVFAPLCHPIPVTVVFFSVRFSPWDEKKIASMNVSYAMVSYLTYLINPFSINPAFESAKSEESRYIDSIY
jgi:hypothetical protein